mgnify:CR=1 FL=1
MTRDQLAAVFNEWARRYAADPASFDQILDEHGVPVDDYGERCALMFEQIASELAKRGRG